MSADPVGEERVRVARQGAEAIAELLEQLAETVEPTNLGDQFAAALRTAAKTLRLLAEISTESTLAFIEARAEIAALRGQAEGAAGIPGEWHHTNGVWWRIFVDPELGGCKVFATVDGAAWEFMTKGNKVSGTSRSVRQAMLDVLARAGVTS